MSFSAFVVKGQLIAFRSDTPRQSQQDVMNSTLFAQLAADAKYDRLQQYHEWYNQYQSILQMIGWVNQNLNFVPVSHPSQYGSVNVVVNQVMQITLSDDDLGLLDRTVDALKSSEDEAAQVYAASTHDSNNANFAAGVCSNNQDNNSILNTGFFIYNTSDKIDNVLFTKISSDKVQFQEANQTMILNNNIYNQIRDAVIQKLGDNVNKYIKPVKV